MNKILIPAVAFVAGMVVAPSAFATTTSASTVSNWADLKACLESGTGGTPITCNVQQGFNIADVAVANRAQITGDVTLNLNGNVITVSNTPALMHVKQGATFKIDNGKIINNTPTGAVATLVAQGDGDTSDGIDQTNVIIGPNAIIEGTNPMMIQGAAPTNESNALTISIEGTLNNTTQAANTTSQALMIHGTLKNGQAPLINVTGTLNGVNSGIYQAGIANTNINGGSVSGDTGIAIKSGTLNLTNATVTATGPYVAPSSNNGGVNPTGDGIQIESNPGYAGDIHININDSDVTSTNGNAIQEYGVDPNALKSFEINGDNSTLTGADGREAFAIDDGLSEPGIMTVNGNQVHPAAFADPTFTTIPTPGVPDTPAPDVPGTTNPDDNNPGITNPDNNNPGITNPGDNTNPGGNQGMMPDVSGSLGLGTSGLLTSVNSKPLSNPNTSDPIASYVGLLTAALLGLGGTFAVAKKVRF